MFVIFYIEVVFSTLAGYIKEYINHKNENRTRSDGFRGESSISGKPELKVLAGRLRSGQARLYRDIY
jgi:hypothetical protein